MNGETGGGWRGAWERDRGSLIVGGAFLLCALAGFLLLGRGAGAGNAAAGGPEDGGSRPGIAVLTLAGEIRYTAGRGMFAQDEGAPALAEQVRRLAENRQVRGLVLRIDSPGGTVGATQELFDALRRFRKTGKPVVACFGDVAASGGYYVACAADRIVAQPGCITGSIGVIMSAPDMNGLYEWAHVKWNVIKSGNFKDILSPYRPMRDDERRLLEEMVRDAYEQFFAAVQEGRKLERVKLLELAQGQIFSGRQAKAHGLVDELGGFEEALAACGKLAGIEGRPYTIRVRTSSGLSGLLRLLEDRLSGPASLGEYVTGKSGVPGWATVHYLYRGF